MLGELRTMLEGGRRTMWFQVHEPEIPWYSVNSFPGYSSVEAHEASWQLELAGEIIYLCF